MKTTVKPSQYKGEISANPSKSIMQRVIALAALSDTPTVIKNMDKSNDSMAALGVCEAMGCDVNIKGDSVVVNPAKTPKHNVWNVGESGLSARMFAPIAGLFEEDITITGKGSLLKRPMNTVIDALEKLGLEVKHNGGYLPLEIKGEITNYNFELDLSAGSQLLTGLLIALSKAKQDSEIKVKNLKSKPYIDLTKCVLAAFGARIENDDYKRFFIPGNSILSRAEFTVEGDWSGVAFHLVGAAISGSVKINGVNPKSKQSDRAILDVLGHVGAEVIKGKNSVFVKKNELSAFEFDATDAPDLFPPLAVLAAYCSGKSKIKGVSRLKHKESNRYDTIKTEFEKLGIKVEQDGDFMIIQGRKPMGGKAYSHNDHRISMALAILGLKAAGNIEIENSESINKSYPGFFVDYKKLGGRS